MIQVYVMLLLYHVPLTEGTVRSTIGTGSGQWRTEKHNSDREHKNKPTEIVALKTKEGCDGKVPT